METVFHGYICVFVCGGRICPSGKLANGRFIGRYIKLWGGRRDGGRWGESISSLATPTAVDDDGKGGEVYMGTMRKVQHKRHADQNRSSSAHIAKDFWYVSHLKYDNTVALLPFLKCQFVY